VNEGTHIAATNLEITSNEEIAAVASVLISPSPRHQNTQVEGHKRNNLSSLFSKTSSILLGISCMHPSGCLCMPQPFLASYAPGQE
jgi:hypothetical protein